MANKALAIFNISGSFGGAEKRYISLYNYLSEQHDDYFLIIDNVLYDLFSKNNLLTTRKNINIIYLRDHWQDKKSESPGVSHEVREKAGTRSSLSGKIKKPLIRVRNFIRQINLFRKFAFQFYHIIKTNKINVVYSVWQAGFFIWPLKGIFKIKHIHSYNDAGLCYLKKGWLDFFDTEYRVLLKCDQIDFLSEGIALKLQKKTGSIDKKRILISPNSFILYDKFYPVLPKLNEVIFLGRLVKERNPMMVLEGIRLYIDRYGHDYPVIFKIIGDGICKNDILNYIHKHGLGSHVKYVGLSYQPWEHLQRSKVFITLANENYPSQSLLEAMACENAVIASDVGETRLLIDEEVGILVTINAGEIAEALYKLFSTPGLIEKLGKNARIKAMNDHNIGKYSNYFSQLMEA